MEGRQREGTEGREGGNGRDTREGMNGNEGKEGKARKGGKDGSRDGRKDGKIADGKIMNWRRGRGRKRFGVQTFRLQLIDRPAGRGGQLRIINTDCELWDTDRWIFETPHASLNILGAGSVDSQKTTCSP